MADEVMPMPKPNPNQQQPPKLTPEQEKAKAEYEKEFDEFARNYMMLNKWAVIEFLFTMRSQLNFALAKIHKLEQKSAPEGEKTLDTSA